MFRISQVLQRTEPYTLLEMCASPSINGEGQIALFPILRFSLPKRFHVSEKFRVEATRPAATLDRRRSGYLANTSSTNAGTISVAGP